MATVSELTSRNIAETQANVRNWGRLVYNVREYGLVGDGVTDDTANLQALIDLAILDGRKTIAFNSGVYYVTALTNADQVFFVGDNASFTGGYAGYIEQLGEMGVTQTEFDKYVAPVINVKGYGAVGDGATDDTIAIQAAINAAFALGDSYFPIIFFPPGTYMISSALSHAQAGNYAQMLGSGRRQTRIKASAVMTEMLVLSSDVGFHGRKLIQGFTFDGNNLAACGIDASYLRYSKIRDNEFARMTVDGYALKFGNYVNELSGNEINGQDSAGGGTATFNGLLVPDISSVNSLVIEKNSFSTCKVGIICLNSPNDIRIQCNVFDGCTGAGIWLKKGARLADISKNFFENCGKTGVSVEVAADTFQTWYGAIVGHTLYTSISLVSFKDLIIKDNQFANCSTDSTMTLAQLENTEIKGNNTLTGYSATYFVNLRWTGSIYTQSKRVYIEHSHDAQYTQLVGLNGDDARLNNSGLVIREYSGISYLSERGFQLKNPFDATWVGAWTVATTYHDGVYTTNEITATATHKTLTLTLSTEGFSAIKGKYLRLHALTKNTVANGLGLKVMYDGVQQIDISATSTAYTNAFRNAVIFVPSTVAVIVFDLYLVLSAQNCFFTKFNICDAYSDFNEMEFLMLDV